MNLSSVYNKSILCSRKLENIDIFPSRNIVALPQMKESLLKERLYRRLFNPDYFIAVNPRLDRKNKNYVVRYLKHNKVDLIHAHFGPSGIEILPIAAKLKIPMLVSFHGFDGSNLLKYRKYLSNLNKLFSYAFVIFPSEYMRRKVVAYVSTQLKSSVIHYGIPLSQFNFINRLSVKGKLNSNQDIILLQVSNFVEKKGHIFTIKAFEKFQKSYPNSKLILAGEGKLKNKIVEIVREMKLNEKIIFPGRIDHLEVSNLMGKADIFLHHSVVASNGDEEGIPNVIMEAMATGLPVISTNHAGIPELITNGINGFLVNEKDIDMYVLALEKAMSLDDQIGVKARKNIEQNFNLDIQNQRIEEVYNDVLNNKLLN